MCFTNAATAAQNMVKKPGDIVSEGSEERALKQDVLGNVETSAYPARLDWLASYLDRNGDYLLNPQQTNEELITNYTFPKTATDPYVEGLRSLVGRTGSVSELDDTIPVGSVVKEYTALVNGLEKVGRDDVAPGEVLSRLVVRDLQRQSVKMHRLAEDFTPDARTPRELLQQLATEPEMAGIVGDLIEGTEDAQSLPERLGRVQLATPLWDHQRRGLAEWLRHEGNGYVDMATATGKTVLGLAAVGYCTESGSLHPEDSDWLADQFEGEPPAVGNTSADDILIVTTDDLLGAQWSRLFEHHCHTPPEYTQVVDGSISLPWGNIEIRAANGVSGLDPSEYRLAIFDEVHNYSQSGGWGDELTRFAESGCPVLALTGSETPALESIAVESASAFGEVFEYGHDEALADGVIPDFEWTLTFVPVDENTSSTLGSLSRTADAFRNTVDAEPNALSLTDETLSGLDTDQREVLSEGFETPTRLAATLRDAGTDGRAPTPELETLAGGLAGRRTHWWNLRPGFDPVEERVVESMAEDRPTLVLTQSYPEATALAKRLDGHVGAETVTRLDQDSDAERQAETIREFDERPTDRKVLIAPGNRIGTGIDIRTVSVGINLARPGTGVNATLVQRLGRLLRNVEGTETVEFYHVLGLPPREAIVPFDGSDFIEDVAEFFAQVELPSTDGMTKLPDVDVTDAARETVVSLERAGANWHSQTTSLGRVEQSYVDAIRSGEYGSPAVAGDWYPTASRWGEDTNTDTASVVTDGGVSATGGRRLVVEVGEATDERADDPSGGDVMVTISGTDRRGVGETRIGGAIQFDTLTDDDYRLVASFSDGRRRIREVTVDDETAIDGETTVVRIEPSTEN